MSAERQFAKEVITLGIRPVLKPRGFKRPGGGSRFVRERDRLRQVVNCWLLGSAHGVRLRLSAEQRVEHHALWSLLPFDLVIDPALGDARDVAIQAACWIEQTLLPRFEEPLDLVGLAHLYERKCLGPLNVHRAHCAHLWTILGFPDEAARLVGDGDFGIPF